MNAEYLKLQAAIDRTRLLLGAAPLDARGDAEIPVTIEDLRVLAALGDEALGARINAAPPSVGPLGKLVCLSAGDDRARLIAEVEFEDEADLARVGALITQAVTIEPASPTLQAANEARAPTNYQGEGSPYDEEDIS